MVRTATATAAKSLQSCPTLCDPIDGSPTPINGYQFKNHCSTQYKVKVKVLAT